MAGLKPKNSIDNFLSITDLYLAPLFMVAIGIATIIIPFTAAVPKLGDLSEVTGRLGSYYFKQTGRGHDDYTTILVLEDGSRFWSDFIWKDQGPDSLAHPGVEVRLYIDRHSKYEPIDGAIKSYGLWVDGKEVQSNEGALEHETIETRLCFPALSLFSFAVAYFIYRHARKKHGPAVDLNSLSKG